MIERLIQTIKRRLSVLNKDPKWSKISLADKKRRDKPENKTHPKLNNKNDTTHSTFQ